MSEPSRVDADDSSERSYNVLCVSMYKSDEAALRAMVAELKRRGFAKANMSHVVRIALANLTVDRAVELMGIR